MYRLLRRHTATIVALALVTSAISACGSTAAPSAPVTETLSGILVPTALSYSVITASGGGDISITLVSLSPLSTITVGVGIGVTTSNGCALQYSQENFKVGTVWNTSLSGKGLYCVAIYDIGQTAQNVNYTLKVTHP